MKRTKIEFIRLLVAMCYFIVANTLGITLLVSMTTTLAFLVFFYTPMTIAIKVLFAEYLGE